MQDHVEIVDRHGRRRRARKGDVLGDGEHWSIPMTFQDEQLPAGSPARVSDGSAHVVDAAGQLAGHRPGFLLPANAVNDRLFADADIDQLRQKANEEYDARRKRMSEAWKRGKKRAPQPGTSRSRGGA
jgi:hypothetical protein